MNYKFGSYELNKFRLNQVSRYKYFDNFKQIKENLIKLYYNIN